MVDLSSSFSKVCEQFKFSELNKHQKEAIISAGLKKKDVFVSLPTDFGKSVIFQAVPMVFDGFTGESGHIVIVVSPLLSLIKDQTERLRQVGISCVSLSDVSTQGDIDLVEGFYSVVYATTESLLQNERWRRMLSSNLYQEKVCAIAVDDAHVINNGKIFCVVNTRVNDLGTCLEFLS